MNDQALDQLNHFLEALESTTNLFHLKLVLSSFYPPCLAESFLGESIEVFDSYDENIAMIQVRFPGGPCHYVKKMGHPDEFSGNAKFMEDHLKAMCLIHMRYGLADYVTDLMTP